MEAIRESTLTRCPVCLVSAEKRVTMRTTVEIEMFLGIEVVRNVCVVPVKSSTDLYLPPLCLSHVRFIRQDAFIAWQILVWT